MHSLIYNFMGLNKAIFIFINNITNISILPNILKVISYFFFIGNFPIYYLILCLYCYFKLKKLSDAKPEFIQCYNKFIEAGICYALFGFTFAALKFMVNLPRPFCSLSALEFHTIIDITQERCLSSFPSAHTGLSILIAYYIWSYLGNYQKIIMIIIIFAVAISRLTLAMHYPADILYSILVTYSLIFLSHKLYNLLYDKLIRPSGFLLLKLLFKV